MKVLSKKNMQCVIALFTLFLYASCFEIVEEVNLNDDGSGSFCFTINMSQSKLQINSMFLLDSVNGRPMPKKEDFKRAINKVETMLIADSNITNVESTRNWEDYIFSVKANFVNVQALNKAIIEINTIFNTPRAYTPVNENNFSYVNKVFERLYNYNLVNDYNALSDADRAVFKNAKYTTVYRFKSPVSSFSNPNALKSKSGKAIMLKVKVKDLVTNKKTIKNIINLK